LNVKVTAFSCRTRFDISTNVVSLPGEIEIDFLRKNLMFGNKKNTQIPSTKSC
jgi:hypothetical protein